MGAPPVPRRAAFAEATSGIVVGGASLRLWPNPRVTALASWGLILRVNAASGCLDGE